MYDRLGAWQLMGQGPDSDSEEAQAQHRRDKDVEQWKAVAVRVQCHAVSCAVSWCGVTRLPALMAQAELDSDNPNLIALPTNWKSRLSRPE